MKDVLPSESALWLHVENTIRREMDLFNYREIRTPILEETGLFARSIGELTDIVTKEMYTFQDRGKESVTMRPEGTAPTIRAYIQNNLGEQSPLSKVFYLGPMFRQERPQAGRLRQFHQFGAEAVGSSSPQLDVEMIILPISIYRRLGVDAFSVKINSVGCEKCRPRYKELLKTELMKVRSKLSPESQARVNDNPLRVLDSKDENDRKLTAHMPLIKDHLCEECRTHFASVQFHLGAVGIKYDIDGRLVRGLDYYTKTAFEISSPALGSQDALAGGGRYDLLVKELGGRATPGVGFAAGIERLLIALAEVRGSAAATPSPDLFIVAQDEASREWSFVHAAELRSKGIATEVDYLGRSVKSQMREANRQNARYVIVVGADELRSGRAAMKEMATGKDVPVSLDAIEIPAPRP